MPDVHKTLVACVVDRKNNQVTVVMQCESCDAEHTFDLPLSELGLVASALAGVAREEGQILPAPTSSAVIEVPVGTTKPH